VEVQDLDGNLVTGYVTGNYITNRVEDVKSILNTSIYKKVFLRIFIHKINTLDKLHISVKREKRLIIRVTFYDLVILWSHFSK